MSTELVYFIKNNNKTTKPKVFIKIHKVRLLDIDLPYTISM